jgi:hypothetical protein
MILDGMGISHPRVSFLRKCNIDIRPPPPPKVSEIVTFLEDLWLLSFTMLPCILHTKPERTDLLPVSADYLTGRIVPSNGIRLFVLKKKRE